MVTQNHKLLKKGERDMVDQVGEEDRISKLCDDLLHHIFSFLPTKCVIRTSILSKRWRYVWNSVSYLDFLEWPRMPLHYCCSQCIKRGKDKDNDNDIDLETKMFMDFMDRMLILRSTGDNYKSTTATTIKKFSLFCNELICDDNRVNTWISALIRCCNVEELIIRITKNHKVQAPKMFPLISLFTCESLTRLDLEGLIFLNLPKSIYLPRLKILGLTFIRFTDECSTEQLFSNCPVLEELRVKCCKFGEMHDLSLIISAPALKSLFINGFYNKININAPNLVSLDYYGAVANQYVLRSLVSVVDAKIDCWEELFWVRSLLSSKENFVGATKLLGGLFNVKRLTVSCRTLKALSYRDDFFTNVPTFYNLIHLEVTSDFLYSNGKALLNLLQISPKLESLVFVQSFDPCGMDTQDDDNDDDDGWTLNMEPQCSQLKLIEFQKFHGGWRELNMVKLFLKNGRGLQRMTMSSSSDLSTNRDKKLQITEQLLMFPRASSSCVVKLI